MKKICRDAVLLGVFLLLTGCASGTVTDKRAPGQPGDKVFQLHVDGALPGRWVTVTEKEWDRCSLDSAWPSCAG